MNKINILLLLLVLLILIYNKIVNSKERFNSFLLGKKPSFIFLDKKEASRVIYSITTFDKYNKKDRELRNIRAETNLADHYSTKLLNWSDNDKLVMNWLFNTKFSTNKIMIKPSTIKVLLILIFFINSFLL